MERHNTACRRGWFCSFMHEIQHHSENGKYHSSFGIAAMVALRINPLDRKTNNVPRKSSSNYSVPTGKMTWANVVGQKHVWDKPGLLRNTWWCFIFMDIWNLVVSDIKTSLLSVDSWGWWIWIIYKYLLKIWFVQSS